MKFTTVLTTAAAIAGVASAPVAVPAPQAEGEATLGLITGLLNGILGGGAAIGGGWGGNGGWGSGWGGNWGGQSSWYYKKKITVIKDHYNYNHYYTFPQGYNPCGCYYDAAYAVSEDDANKLIDDASYAVETNTAVTAQPIEDASSAPVDAPAPAASST